MANRKPSNENASNKQRSRRVVPRQIDIPDDVFLAASVGDLEWLKHSVAGTNFKKEIPYDQNGFSPLHVAAAHARLNCIRFCIEKLHYDVNLPSQHHSWTPIQMVVNHLNDDRVFPCLKYLILKGADVNSANVDGTTAMHQAAAEGDNECLKALIEKGANPLVEDARGCSPLQLAKIWNHHEAARVIESAIWRLTKDDNAKQQHIFLEMEKDKAITDIRVLVNKFSENQGEGNMANWMKNHGLDDDSAKNVKNKRDKSVHPGLRMQGNVPEPPPSPFNKPRVEKMNKKHGSLPRSKHFKVMNDDAGDLNISDDEDEYVLTGNDIRHIDIERLRAYHENPWNKSTKVTESEYIPDLQDIYPRDEYTKTPTKFSTPFLSIGDVRGVKSVDIIGEPLRQVRYDGRGPPMEKVDAENPHRPTIFKAYRNIIDMDRLRKLSWADLPRDEASLHLVNDPRSNMFKNALQPSVLDRNYEFSPE